MNPPPSVPFIALVSVGEAVTVNVPFSMKDRDGGWRPIMPGTPLTVTSLDKDGSVWVADADGTEYQTLDNNLTARK